MASREQLGELDTGRTLDWSAIYARLAAHRDDAVAWAALQTWVTVWARRALGDLGPDEVEDAVAETCATTLLTLEKARGPETFSGFVYGHFLNVRQRLLRRHREPLVPIEGIEVADQADEGPTPDEIALLRACLDELLPRERHAVQLRYFDDASAEQIAAALGVKVGNARRIVFNGLARLRECAQRAWPGGRG